VKKPNWLWFIYGPQTWKSILATVLLVAIVFGFAFKGSASGYITQVVFDTQFKCVVGWVIDGKLERHPNFKDQPLPTQLKVEYVQLQEKSLVFDKLKETCQMDIQ
jgi:hypothetical protein